MHAFYMLKVTNNPGERATVAFNRLHLTFVIGGRCLLLFVEQQLKVFDIDNE